MSYGHVRDNFPRIVLMLPGRAETVNVEFIIDTGFDGELAVPHHLCINLMHRRRIGVVSDWLIDQNVTLPVAN